MWSRRAAQRHHQDTLGRRLRNVSKPRVGRRAGSNGLPVGSPEWPLRHLSPILCRRQTRILEGGLGVRAAGTKKLRSLKGSSVSRMIEVRIVSPRTPLGLFQAGVHSRRPVGGGMDRKTDPSGGLRDGLSPADDRSHRILRSTLRRRQDRTVGPVTVGNPRSTASNQAVTGHVNANRGPVGDGAGTGHSRKAPGSPSRQAQKMIFNASCVCRGRFA